jgi:hypothetical protein
MRVFVLFLRRLVEAVSGWALFAALIGLPLVLGLWGLRAAFTALTGLDGSVWMPILMAAGFTALFAVLRALAGLAPRRMAGLLGRMFDASGIMAAEMVNELPADVGLRPADGAGFRNPAALRACVDRLAARGFVEVGTYTLALAREVPVVLLASPADRLRATLFDHDRGRLIAEFVTEYADGRWVGYSNGPDRGLDPMPGRTSVRYTGDDPLAVLDRCLAGRPAGEMLAVEPGTAAAFARESDAWIEWRRQAGFRPHEVGAKYAGLIRAGLNILTVGLALMTLVTAALTAGLWAARPYLPAAALVGIVVAVLVAVPVLLTVASIRRLGRPAPRETEPAPEPAPEPAGPPEPLLKRKVGPLYEAEKGSGSVVGPLAALGLEPVGVFEVGGAVLAAVWVRPGEGVYAVVWNYLACCPWVEVVAAGADGAARRVSQLTGPGADGRFALASGPSTDVAGLYARCLAAAAGVPRAEVTPGTVAGVLSAHLAADPDWWARVYQASGALAATWRGVAKGLLILAGVTVVCGLYPLARLLGFEEEVVSESAWRVTLVGLIAWVVLPVVSRAWASARKQAAAERAGNTTPVSPATASRP